MNGGDELVLDADQWQVEATAQMKDIEQHVKFVALSETLPSEESGVFINLTTLEDRTFCVRLSNLGFRVVGEAHDVISPGSEERFFETPYALLTAISPGYQQSVGQALMSSLERLAQDLD